MYGRVLNKSLQVNLLVYFFLQKFAFKDFSEIYIGICLNRIHFFSHKNKIRDINNTYIIFLQYTQGSIETASYWRFFVVHNVAINHTIDTAKQNQKKLSRFPYMLCVRQGGPIALAIVRSDCMASLIFHYEITYELC